MNSICLACHRNTRDRNLFCQEPTCPAEYAPRILAVGDWLGAFEIVQPLVVASSFALYEAERSHTRVLLKIAMPGEEHSARLVREARKLQLLGRSRVPHPIFPQLISPYIPATNEPFGRIAIGDQLLTYWAAARPPGEPLRDLLRHQPQPDPAYVGWLVSQLADTIALLQQERLAHLAICPEALLVLRDQSGQPARMTLIDLGLCAPLDQAQALWYSQLAPPMAHAPEVASRRPVTPTADVYGLGALLETLLHGEAAGSPALIARRDSDVAPLAELARATLQPNPESRPRDAREVAQRITAIVGAPAPLKPPRFRMETAVFAMLALLSIAFVIAIVIALPSAISSIQPPTPTALVK